MISVTPARCIELAISGTSAQTAALPEGGYHYVLSTVDCFVTTGSNPTATMSGNGNFFLLAGTYAAIHTSKTTTNEAKIAAIAATSGTLYVSYTGD
jgi:hypothetical protein